MFCQLRNVFFLTGLEWVEHQYILQRQRNIYSSSDGESHSGQQHSEDRHLLSVEPAERPMMKILMRLRP